MAKLYWRYKKNGKWTWVAATEENTLWRVGRPWESYFLEDNPTIVPEE